MIDLTLSLILRNNPEITAKVQNRIYPLIAPSIEPPFIVYQSLSRNQTNHINNDNSIETAVFQIDIYSKSFSDVCELASILTTELHLNSNDTYSHNIQFFRLDDERTGFEKETELFRKSLDFTLFH